MPIDNFKQRQNGRRAVVNSNNTGGQIPHRQVTTRPMAARRNIDDFRRADGYYPLRKPLMGPSQIQSGEQKQKPEPENNSILYKNLSGNKYQPLLAKTNQSVPRSNMKRRIKRWTKRTVLLGGMAFIVVGGFLFVKSYIKLHEIFGGSNRASALQASNIGRVNILLLGIGGGTHAGPDLTDTMMVASIDPVNNKAVLLSLPRDLWVKMPNNYISSYQKINAAYESGKYAYLGEESASNSNQKAIFAGFKTVDSTVSNVIGVPINYNVLVDFQAFKQAVDDVGGVTVNVPTELYDPTMAHENNWNPVLAEPGVQTMDGYKALMYARSRETTSDFARAQRQRAILVALKNKVLSLGTLSNPFKISSLLSAFGDNVRTDLSLNDAEALYGIMKKINNNDIKSADLVTGNYVTTGTLDGISVVEPTAGAYDYSAIRTYVHGLLRDGHLAKENAKIAVLNGTPIPGAATTTTNSLKDAGYQVLQPGNAANQNYMHTVIVDLTNGQDQYTAKDLERRFHTTVVDKLPSGQIQPKGANFVIIVGEDEATSG